MDRRGEQSLTTSPSLLPHHTHGSSADQQGTALHYLSSAPSFLPHTSYPPNYRTPLHIRVNARPGIAEAFGSFGRGEEDRQRAQGKGGEALEDDRGGRE